MYGETVKFDSLVYTECST